MNAKVRSQNDELLCQKCGHSINEHSKACNHHDVINPANWINCDCKQSAQDIAAQAVAEARKVERTRTRELLEEIFSRLNNSRGDSLVRKFLTHKVTYYLGWYADTKPISAEQEQSS